MAGLLREMVSGNRRRMVTQDGFDLDLSYITPRIIAMGFPASGTEGLYRNSIRSVASFLATRHGTDYLVFNVSERKYDAAPFANQMDMGFPDHHAPPLNVLWAICKTLKSWLDSSPSHVAAIHCKAGKGRTGVIIACFLMYSGAAASAEEALSIFAERRSHIGIGVQVPSQRRYVHYFERVLLNSKSIDSLHVSLPTPRKLGLQKIFIASQPQWAGRHWALIISTASSGGEDGKIMYNSAWYTAASQRKEKGNQSVLNDLPTMFCPECHVEGDVLVRGFLSSKGDGKGFGMRMVLH
eukprot:g4413.t1